ncbi:hypothetical protein AGMMS49938_03260 [Fibrobacterales bacterium]|nr:hypothetical protein AGMMS49938_03260 [Fibrobacterales bacterium]
MNKWLSILLMLGFATTNFIWAQDDYEDEEYEEEAPVVKKKPKKKEVKESAPAGPSRIGLSVGFNGGDPIVGGVYDLGSGIEISLGLGFDRKAYTPDEGDAPDAVQTITIVPGISYALGKGLLDYGIGLRLGITSKDAGTDITAFPNFYTNAEITKNVSIGLSAGINVANIKQEGGANLNINFQTAGTITFYFL